MFVSYIDRNTARLGSCSTLVDQPFLFSNAESFVVASRVQTEHDVAATRYRPQNNQSSTTNYAMDVNSKEHAAGSRPSQIAPRELSTTARYDSSRASSRASNHKVFSRMTTVGVRACNEHERVPSTGTMDDEGNSSAYIEFANTTGDLSSMHRMDTRQHSDLPPISIMNSSHCSGPVPPSINTPVDPPRSQFQPRGASLNNDGFDRSSNAYFCDRRNGRNPDHYNHDGMFQTHSRPVSRTHSRRIDLPGLETLPPPNPEVQNHRRSYTPAHSSSPLISYSVTAPISFEDTPAVHRELPPHMSHEHRYLHTQGSQVEPVLESREEVNSLSNWMNDDRQSTASYNIYAPTARYDQALASRRNPLSPTFVSPQSSLSGGSARPHHMRMFNKQISAFPPRVASSQWMQDSEHILYLSPPAHLLIYSCS
jgi:hypothetical protein